MALDPLYIPLNYLQEYFVDKQTGLPLAAGKVYFWHDTNRNSLKTVYQLSSSPTYHYTALPNPLTLSNAGTFVDNSGNDIAVYCFPYDANGLPDNYYIQVFAAGEPPPPIGIPMFTREAIPGVTASSGPNAVGPQSFGNALANPQFSQVLFDPVFGMSIPYIAGAQSIEIAPGWQLEIIASASGTVTVEQTAINGNANYPTNPPYTLTITPGGNISSLILFQRLFHSPGIFTSGFISAGILLGPASQSTEIRYQDSAGSPPLQILNAASAPGSWVYRTDTKPIGVSSNNQTSTLGYVDIQIVLNRFNSTTFSSVQVVGLATEEENLAYNEQSVNEQATELFYYYQPKIDYKQSDSYLVGWDFPMNPAQFGDTYAPLATGVNQGLYAWDQTIIFTTVANSMDIDRHPRGTLQIIARAAGQLALIQYLDQPTARKIINDRASVRLAIAGSIDAGNGVGCVSLWATATTPLPVLPTTLLTGLNANGIPTGTVAGWIEIPNVYQDNRFLVPAISATNDEANDIIISGWDLAGEVPCLTAEYFAIVVSFSELAIADRLNITSISLCGGDIPSRPAPKTFGETLQDCERYYWKTFETATVPVQNAGLNTGYLLWTAQANPNNASATIDFSNVMSVIPTVTVYNPLNASADVRNISATTNVAASVDNTSTKRTTISATGAGAAGNQLACHLTADARLGIV